MATGLTQTQSEQKAIDVSSFIADYYINELKRLIDEKHFFIAFLVVTAGIEFLGKATSEHDWFEAKESKTDFNDALNRFSSLNKYSQLNLEFDKKNNDVSFYSIVRCGIVHASRPKAGITLTEANNNFPTEIGIIDLVADFNAACNDLLNSKVSMGKGKKLSDIICYY